MIPYIIIAAVVIVVLIAALIAALWLAQPLCWLRLHQWGFWYVDRVARVERRSCTAGNCEAQQTRVKE